MLVLCRWTLSGGHAIGQVSSNIVPMPRFLYVDPSRLFPAATPTAPAQLLGPASQAYCVLPWLMMTSGKLGKPPLTLDPQCFPTLFIMQPVVRMLAF